MEACLRYYGLRRRVLLGCQRSRPTWYRHGYDAPCAFTDRRGKVAVGQRVVAPVGLPPIAAIEFALLSEPSRHEEPALGFRFMSEDERANLLRLLPVGTELVLTDDGNVAA